MTDPRASMFWQAAVRSGLIDADRLTACWEAIPAEKRTPDAIDRRLARQTVNAGHMTLWQAQQILAGRLQGLKIDRYELQDLLGQGGMGRVYLARDTRLRRPVALKILSRERMNNPRALARFRREARVGAQLQHENLIRVYDEGEYQSVRYLVMEYITGRNVGQLIAEQGRLPVPLAAELTRQVALGLEHLHQKGLLHRDVNPLNILVDRDGTAKLTDLGLAIDPGDDEEEVVTRDGATVGTFDYISPEQARHSRQIDTRSDIYSLGCTIYHMLSGRVPFPAPSLPEKLFAHQSGEADSLNRLVPDVPEALDAVVRRMMSKRPEDRYTRPRDVARALEEFCGGPEYERTPPEPIQAAAISRQNDPEAVTVVERPTARTDGSDPDLAPAREGTAAANGVAPSPTPEPPATPLLGSGSDDPFRIDLGPPLPLSDSLSESRSRDGDEEPVKRPWLVPAVLAGVLLTAFLGMLTWGLFSWGEGQGQGGEARPVEPAKPDPAAIRSAIRVEYDNDDEPREATDLADAISLAIGKPATVVLRNAEPLTLVLERPIPIRQGDLRIRAGEGTNPVVAVELKGASSFLDVGTKAGLQIRGIGFTVHRSAGAPGRLIDAHGRVDLDRVAFATAPGSKGEVALRAGGLRTVIKGCWFEGFERPIELSMLDGAEARLDGCMIVRAGGEDTTSWAVDARTQGPGARPRRLLLDRCTIVGAGLLAGTGFDVENLLEVEVTRSIVDSRALLMWDGSFPPEGLMYRGLDNLYRITGAAWAVKPPQGFDAMEDSPSNLESWIEGPIEDEGTDVRALRFLGAPLVPGAVRPSDLRLADFDGEAPGADPAEVGPPRPPASNSD